MDIYGRPRFGRSEFHSIHNNGIRTASVNIPNSVTSIGYNAFRGCISLASVTIGNSVTSIGNLAFQGCHKLFEVVNLSSLNITKGSTNYGYVGCYAMNIFTSAGDATVKTT